MGDFNELLAYGQIGESKIAQWLRNSRGWSVLPVYEKQIDNGKGPRFFLPKGQRLVAPDMLVFRGEKLIWVEAKHKTVFSWHRLTERWVTGIDQHHYNQYLEVAAHTGFAVWLLFLHESSTPRQGDLSYGCPRICPTGLFGCHIGTSPNHTAPPARNGNGWGKSGMVYWAHKDLHLLATTEEIRGAQKILLAA